MKKKIFSLITALIFTSVFSNLVAQDFSGLCVQNFYEDNATTQKASKTSSDESCSDMIFEFMGDLCCSFLELLWLESHMNCSFDEYPYANGNKYIIHQDFLSTTEDDYFNMDFDDKFYRFTFETGIFSLPELNYFGSETRIEGYIYKFFGPVFENLIFTKGSFFDGSSNDNLIGNLRLGGTFNLVNFNPINIAINVQWTHWYGAATNNGVTFGIIARSYPVKPLMLEWRGNWQILDKTNYNSDSDPCIFESHLEAGIMSGRIEIFAAWKYIYDGYKEINTHGASLGVKLHI